MTEQLIQRFHELARSAPDPGADAESLIGFFQTLRPDGHAVEGLFEGVAVGDQLESRLNALYQAAGDDRRPSGGRDAYFVVRQADPLASDDAQRLGEELLANLFTVASERSVQQTIDAMTPMPSVRVLEGIPPKQPKRPEDKSDLFLAIQESGREWLSTLCEQDPVARTLAPAYYFIACDWMLRDYLMWPLYASHFSGAVRDPFRPYFDLWRHGVKLRMYGNVQVDVYLPRAI